MKSAAGLSYMTRADERAQDTLPIGNTPKVFISYKKDEKKQVTDEGLLYTRDLAAKRVVNLSDCAVWHDGLLTPGGDYNTEIRSAILECDAVVLLLTSNVLTSKYIWDIEIKLAKENNKIIIPIAFDFPKHKYRYVEESIGNVHIISWPGGGDDDAAQRDDSEFNDALSRALDRLAVSSSLAGEINKIQEIINGRSSLTDISLNSWYLMGRACLEGINVQQDIERGVGLLNAVAHIENASEDVAALRCRAANALFAHYYELHRTNGDAEALKKCRKLADLGAELNDAELTYRLGYMFQKGRGAGRAPEKAAEIYARAAELGSAKAMCALGIMHRSGDYVPRDNAAAFRLLSAAAEKGDGEAMWNLAEMYDRGEGTVRNEALAEKWYVNSAKIHGGHAMRKLGDRYKEEGDHASAFKWYYNSAQQGDGIAMRDLGHMYRRGTHVERDYGRAFGWYYRAAAVGNFVAMRYLGLMYSVGLGVDADENRMQQWFEKSVDFGGLRAANSLGRMYYVGDDLPCDYSRAAYWYSRAAELGSEPAAKYVAELAAKGYPVPDLSVRTQAAVTNEPAVKAEPPAVSQPVVSRPLPNTAPQPEPAAAPLSKKEAKAALKAQKALEKQMAKEAKAAAKEAKKQARGR